MMHSSCCCCDGNECTVFVFCCTGITGAEGCGAREFIGVVSIGSSATPDSYSRYSKRTKTIASVMTSLERNLKSYNF